MKIKKIVAPTMHQAIEKVKKELGPEAVIFHTKKVKRSKFFNLLKTENIEVFAATDPYPIMDLKKENPLVNQLPVASDDKQPRQKKISVKPQQTKELDYISHPDEISKLRESMIRQGLTVQHVDMLTQVLVKKWYQSDEQLTSDDLRHVLADALSEKLSSKRFQGVTYLKKFVTVVGSTGVGKTTTLAKLAAKAVLEDGKSAAFITTDTYRIAAIEQLKTYANILNIPVEIAYSIDDFLQAIDKLSSYDVVFIDTAGRNFQDEHFIRELEKTIPFDQEMEAFLVMAATAKFDDMTVMLQQFSRLPISQFIFTKLDETTTIGSIVSVLLNHPNYDVAYVTNGQNVPDDLIEATQQMLIKMFMGTGDHD